MVWDFFWSAFLGGGLTTTLLLIAGFLGRSQIAHWLDKDIERAKAQHLRELEAYKVTLIAEVERIKADQEVKKAGALLLMNRQVTALGQIMEAVAGLSADVVATAKQPAAYKTAERADEIIGRVDALRRMRNQSAVWFSPEEMAMFRTHHTALLEVLNYCTEGAAPLAGEAFANLSVEAFDAENAIDVMIVGKVAGLQGQS